MAHIDKLTYQGADFPVYLAEPTGAVKGGLIVIHEVWGLNDHIRSIADRFAAQGYLALAPDLLSETEIAAHGAQLQADLFNPEKRNEAQPKMRAMMAPLQEPGFAVMTVGRLSVCFDYLHGRPETKGVVSVSGFCFGGSYSYSLAMKERRLACAIAFYGHAPLDEAELKKIACPVLAFYGEKDERLITDLPELKTLMKSAGVDYTAQVYPNCGHAFFNDTNKFSYNGEAAAASWKRALAQLERAAASGRR